MNKYSAEKLEKLVCEIFIKKGMSDEDAATIAKCLIDANLIGRDSHGLLRIPCYLNRIDRGGTILNAPFEIINETPTTALVDANHGMGMITAEKASNLTRKKALESGMAFVTVKNADHYGAAAYWAEKIGQDDIIAFSSTNTEALMAPPGGKKVMLGTNPICMYVPTKSYGPLCLDIATSTIAQGKLFDYKLKHKELGEGWSVDIDGNPTKDPEKAAFLIPFGAHKGYGIAVFVEVLCAILSGGAIGAGINSLANEPDKPNNISFCFAGLKIESFRDPEEFKEDMDRLVEYLHSTPAAEGKSVLVPGEIEIKTRQKNLQEGISIPEDLEQSLRNIAKELNVDFD